MGQKYKVGDRVLVRDDLEDHGWYAMCGSSIKDCAVINMIDRFSGRLVTIKSVSDKYRICEDDGVYNWTDEMFNGLVELELDDKEISADELLCLCTV